MSADGTEPITVGQAYIDSRDVIARIAYLESVESDAETLDADLPEGEAQFGLDEAERQELTDLRELAEEGESLADWPYGETLIEDYEFENYARDLAQDIGAITGEEGWPANCIDWEKAASELQQDYTAISFGHCVYWGRS